MCSNYLEKLVENNDKINTIYETGEWLNDFTEVTMISRRNHKLQNAHNHTITLISYTATIVQRYLEEGLKGKLRMYLEMINLDLEEEHELVMQLGC
jgi:hypothetical protein